MTNAQIALEAASRIHQRVAAGSGASASAHSYSDIRGDIKVFESTDNQILTTAEKFYQWLESKSGESDPLA